MQKGYAVFLPPSASLADLRRETRRALLAGQKAAAYEIICEEYVYPGHFLQTLHHVENLHAPDHCMPDGTLCCSALWDVETGHGILLHRAEGRIFCAYLPVLTLELARREDALICELDLLCAHYGNTSVLLAKPIPVGIHSLQDLIRTLADTI